MSPLSGLAPLRVSLESGCRRATPVPPSSMLRPPSTARRTRLRLARAAASLVSGHLGPPTASPSCLVASSVEQLDQSAGLGEVVTFGDQTPPDVWVAQDLLAIVNDHRLFARLVDADQHCRHARNATGSRGTGARVV